MRTIIFSLFVTSYTAIFSQDGISIGRPAADASAMLHLTAPSRNQGIIFPKSASRRIRTITNPADGLFLYDSIINRYAYLRDNTWMYFNPWDTEGINENNATGNDEDISAISTPYEVTVEGSVRANRLAGFGTVPLEGIIMWSGDVDNIPVNYELCDGGARHGSPQRNGIDIPNLVGRFIRGGRGSNTGVIAEGGVDAKTTTRISYEEVTGGGATARDMATSTENKPPFFDLAYLIRVE